MGVYNFGSLNIDHIYRLDHIAAPGETLAADTLSFAAGGKGLNQSIALAQSGAEIFHVGCIGSDGIWLKELLEQKGVYTDHVKQVEAVTGHAIIQVSETGQNSIVIFGGANQAMTEEQVDSILAQATSDDLVLLQNETSCVPYIARRCAQLGIPLAFNPSPISRALLEIFPFEAVKYLLVNETEAAAITGTDIPEEAAKILLAKYPELCLVMTLGSQGVYYRDQFMALTQPGFPVEAVDTTGAGDTFAGYFLGMITRGRTCAQALRYACAAAAIAVTRHGAAPSIPSLAEVEEFLK